MKHEISWKKFGDSGFVKNMWWTRYKFHMLFQISFACQQLKKAANLLHFDVRFDNVFVQSLDEPKDFFGHGLKSDFVVKIGDWGLCEFDFGGKRCRQSYMSQVL